MTMQGVLVKVADNDATIPSCPHKDLTSSRRFACPTSGNIYV